MKWEIIENMKISWKASWETEAGSLGFLGECKVIRRKSKR